MHTGKSRAFSLIELIAAMSVVLALAIVAFAYASSYKSGVENTKRLADIDALQNVADSYFKAKGTYPTPKANAIPYDKEGRYSHDATPYGYSSFVSDDLFGADFLKEVPHDPSNNAYYAYGKQNASEESPNGSYDFATVDLNEWIYYAYVRGNYDASRLVSLIRSYNSPEFVQNGTDKYLPYNPYEMKLTGKISSSSGSVFVIRGSTTYGPTAFTGELVQDDTIKTIPWSYATLYFADGSEVRLGDDTQTGSINIASLTYKDRSIATRLKLYLQEGSVWTKAPKLRDASDDGSLMEVETDSAVAAVRGTIFGVETLAGGGSKMLIKDGNVEISTGTTILSTLTGWLGNYEMVAIPRGTTAPTTPVSFTGGTPMYGPALMKATGEWNDSLLKSRKPDISSLERTATGFVVRANVAEEDTNRWLCLGNASGSVLENFADMSCQQITDSGSHAFSFVDSSLLPATFSGLENPAFATCENNTNYPSVTSANICSASLVLSANTASTFGPVAIDGKSVNCSDKDRFGPLGCIGENTIAYAPYDTVSDLNMYYRQENGTIGKLPVKTNGWSVTTTVAAPLDDDVAELLEVNPAWSVNSGTGIDILNPGKSFAYRKEFFNKDISMGDGNIVFTGINGQSPENGADNGIMVGTGANAGYLAYDLSSLNLGETFSIEARVRGDALKRTDGSHYIWDDGDDGVALRYQSTVGGVGRFILETRSVPYSFANTWNNNCTWGGSSYPTKYFCSSNDPSLFQNNIYYTIRTEFDKKTIRLYIDNNLVGTVQSSDPGKYFKSKQLLIWYKPYTNQATLQWNGVISSIKITK